MGFEPKEQTKFSLQHLIDRDTGIEVWDKNWEKRQRTFAMTGEDTFPTMTFIVFDPSVHSENHGIEFVATRLFREMQGQAGPRADWYGLEVRTADFNKAFLQYAKGDMARLAAFREYVKGALRRMLGTRSNTLVNFV